MILRRKAYSRYLMLFTMLLPFVAVVFSYLVLSRLDPTLHYVTYQHYVFLILIAIIWYSVCKHYHLFAAEYLFRERTSILVTSYPTVVTCGITAMVLYFARGFYVPRSLLLLSSALLFFLAFASRYLFRFVLANSVGRTSVRVLIVGTDQFARRTARLLRTVPFGNCTIAGFVHIPSQPNTIKNGNVWESNQMGQIDANAIDEIVVTVPLSRSAGLKQVIGDLEHTGCPIRAVIDTGMHLNVPENLYRLGRLQILELGTGPFESWEYRILKRVFDILFSAIVLILASPILLLIVAAIKLTSPGPIIFVQERVGRHGRIFQMYKFRSMRIQRPTESDRVWTTQNDPRCTWIGAFLRRSCLDELPQFFNVLRGDMSVVGPRPERPFFVTKFRREIADYNKRHGVSVGITGWAQVNGLRGDTSIERRVEYDLFYLKNWSMLLDLKIIGLTLLKGIWGENAY